MPFADLDARIAAAAGRPIPAIFAGEGEAGFRAREAAALRGTAGFGGVVALGGGALVDDASRAWAKAHGCVVYLRARPAALAARLAATAAGRPLLHDDAGQPLPPGRLRARVAALLAVRAATYADAHVAVRAEALRVGGGEPRRRGRAGVAAQAAAHAVSICGVQEYGARRPMRHGAHASGDVNTYSLHFACILYANKANNDR